MAATSTTGHKLENKAKSGQQAAGTQRPIALATRQPSTLETDVDWKINLSKWLHGPFPVYDQASTRCSLGNCNRRQPLLCLCLYFASCEITAALCAK